MKRELRFSLFFDQNSRRGFTQSSLRKSGRTQRITQLFENQKSEIKKTN